MPKIRSSVWMIVPNLLRTLFRRDVSWKSKALLLGGLVYLISPVDLLPDILVGIGWLDDLVIVPLLGWLSYRSLSPAIQDDVAYFDQRAAKSTRRVWLYLLLLVVAIVVIAIWGDAQYPVSPTQPGLAE